MTGLRTVQMLYGVQYKDTPLVYTVWQGGILYPGVGFSVPVTARLPAP